MIISKVEDQRFPANHLLILWLGSTPETPLFVDVGGGIGTQSIELKKRLSSNVAGRIIVQDQLAIIAQVSQEDGVEVMPYNFWEAQPVKCTCRKLFALDELKPLYLES